MAPNEEELTISKCHRLHGLDICDVDDQKELNIRALLNLQMLYKMRAEKAEFPNPGRVTIRVTFAQQI